MPQSLTKLYAHLIFSTKTHERWLDDEIRSRVHAYLATVIRDLDSPWVVVGSVEDHVHILFDIGKKTAPMKFVEHVKRDSSKFIKTLGSQYGKFYVGSRNCRPESSMNCPSSRTLPFRRSRIGQKSILPRTRPSMANAAPRQSRYPTNSSWITIPTAFGGN